MSKGSATVVAGTAGASFPFWSPDERHLGFFADRKLEIVEIAGEPFTSSRTCKGRAGAPGETGASSSSRRTSTVPSIRSLTLAEVQLRSVVSSKPTAYEVIVGLCFYRMVATFSKSRWRPVSRLATSVRFASAQLIRPMTNGSPLKVFVPSRSLSITSSLFETECSTPSGSTARSCVPPATRYR